MRLSHVSFQVIKIDPHHKAAHRKLAIIYADHLRKPKESEFHFAEVTIGA